MMVEYLSVQALLDLPDPRISLHGALVSHHGKGLLILGAGETGKSTLACALWQRGWALLSDDRTLVDAQNLTAYPTPRRISLRKPSRALLGDFLWRRIRLSPSCTEARKGLVFHPHEIDGRARLLSTDLAAIIFLARRGTTTSAAELKPIASATALLALLGYSNLTLRISFGEAIKRLQPLAASIPAYDFGRGPLSEMTQKLEELLSGL
jgi:hypothetical protein